MPIKRQATANGKCKATTKVRTIGSEGDWGGGYWSAADESETRPWTL